jgi:predicted metal-dependent hydrolase
LSIERWTTSFQTCARFGNGSDVNPSKPPPIYIRRSPRAKRLRLVVKPGLIELVVPPAAQESTALAFLAKHRAWAEIKYLEMDAKARQVPAIPRFTLSQTLPWRGKDLPLLIQESAGGRYRVEVDDGKSISITLPAGLGANRDEMALRAFYRWTQHWLRGRVAHLAHHHAARFGLLPRGIRIKSMKTRWGSCGPRNDININWLLALAPDSVLEYVVVHEICHIRERNHSPKFWALVAEHLPDYLDERHWVKRHGADLMRRFAV